MPNLLDAIPEVIQNQTANIFITIDSKVMRDANRNNSNKEEELLLPYDDIAEVISSSNDIRFKAKSIFKSSSSQSSFHNTSPTFHATSKNHGESPSLGLSQSNSSSHLTNSSPKNANSTFPHRRSPFNARKEKEKASGSWISTGLVPHFLIITFYEK